MSVSDSTVRRNWPLRANAATVVVGSQTSALSKPSKTMGVGDYVWAGLAGMLSAASDSASLTPSSTVSESSQTVSAQDGTLLSTSVPTESDDQTVIDGLSASSLASTNPSSTGLSTIDRVSTQQTPTPSTNRGTTSQAGPSDRPDAPVPSSSSSSSSSPSSSIETQPENDSGRVAVSATFALCGLILLVTVFA